MSVEAERLREALDLYRQHEHTDRREEMYNNLRSVVESIKRRRRNA